MSIERQGAFLGKWSTMVLLSIFGKISKNIKRLDPNENQNICTHSKKNG
jgi:hypothetical protein